MTATPPGTIKLRFVFARLPRDVLRRCAACFLAAFLLSILPGLALARQVQSPSNPARRSHPSAQPTPAPAKAEPASVPIRLAIIRNYLKTGEYAKGVALARSLSASAPGDVRVHFSLGVLLASASQWKPAIHEFELADALRPGTFAILDKLGQAYLSDGAYSEAEQAFGRALALQPDSVDALYGQARAYQGQDKILQALQRLFRARKLAPRNTDVIFLLARLSMKQSYFEDAIPLLEEGIKIDPRRADLHAALGESYYSAGRIAEAHQQFQTLLKLHPSASSDSFMGLYYQHQGQFDKAKEYFEAGLQKDPHNATCLYNLGVIASKQGDYAAAARLLEQALSADPRNVDAAFELASAKMEQKQFAEAVPLLERAKSIDPNQAKTWYKLAIAEQKLHQNQAAAADLKVFETLAKNPAPLPAPFQNFFESVSHKESLSPRQQAELDLSELLRETQAHPDRPRGLYLLAQTYLKLGQPSEALQTLAQLQQISGDDVRTMTGAGVLLARYRQYPAAIQYFNLALKANPASDDAKYDLAEACFETHDYARALEWLSRISRPDAATLALTGEAEARLGQLEKAQASLKKAIETSPDNDGYYLSLALAEIQANHLEQARQTLLEGRRRIPNSGKVIWGMGVLAVVEGRNTDAENDFRQALDLLPQWESSYSVLGAFYFDTGQVSKASQTLDRYARIFPHGQLNVEGLRHLLAESPRETAPISLSPPARARFLAMALTLADVRPN
ncbi:MAG: tetratricopeptide repeat protein [Acidobacteriota bacterium]|nr:tetratricopeptide repeat protein [Acidobacteriota bacterium]